jgi:arginyl-tRNA synthetase
VPRAAEQNEPSVITNPMIGTAGEIPRYLTAHHVLRSEPEVHRARVALLAAARSRLRTGLALLGVSAPDSM